MSGRVRWVRGRHFGCLTFGDGLFMQVIRCDQTERWWSGNPDLPTFKRRSDAKRWLMARAAGLAEVPTMRKPRRWDAVSARLAVCIAGRDRRRR